MPLLHYIQKSCRKAAQDFAPLSSLSLLMKRIKAFHEDKITLQKGVVCMYWKYSVGFLIASLVQAGIIMASEFLGVSTLGAKLSFGQLIIHILAGQAAGFLLMVVMQALPVLTKTNFALIGTVYGAIVWAVLIPINSMQGTINAPWIQGASTVIASLLAFISYGLISAYTIKIFGEEQVRT
jgi:hypothetical protein